MANNRMYLVCKRCDPGPTEAALMPSRFYLAKYYPSTGWFNYGESDYAEKMNAFFETHRHAEGEAVQGYLFDDDRRYGSTYGDEDIVLELEQHSSQEGDV